MRYVEITEPAHWPLIMAPKFLNMCIILTAGKKEHTTSLICQQLEISDRLESGVT
jgi:hypothetical protein